VPLEELDRVIILPNILEDVYYVILVEISNNFKTRL